MQKLRMYGIRTATLSFVNRLPLLVRYALLPILLLAGGVSAQSPRDLPSGKHDTSPDPADLPDLPSGTPFRPGGSPDDLTHPEGPAPAPKAETLQFIRVTEDGLSHSPCWAEGGRLLFIRSEADYDPAGTDAAFWRAFENGQPGAGDSEAAVHPLNYAKGQVIVREPDGSLKTATRFDRRHLRGLRCPENGPYAALLSGAPGEPPVELTVFNWRTGAAEGASPPLMLGAEGVTDFAWSGTGERLYILKDGKPWSVDPASGKIEKVKLPGWIAKFDWMALWAGPKTSDLVLAVLDRDHKGRPFGNSLYAVNTKALTAVRLPPPKKGLGTRFEQWLTKDETVHSSTDFVRFRLFRTNLRTGAKSEIRPLPGDADGLWRWHGLTGAKGVSGIWARWNGSSFDRISLVGEDTSGPTPVRDGNFRYVLLSPDGTRVALDFGAGGSAINGLDIRRDIGILELPEKP